MTKPNPAFTKERLYLEHAMGHGMPTVIRHLNRYKWAAFHLPKHAAVLDAGCGSGYGDYILLNSCDTVVGIDASKEAIDYAKWKAEKQKQNRLRYECQDLSMLDLSETFDAAVCIEVIEHLKEPQQRAFMGRMRRFLKDDGFLLITTPIKKNDGPMTHFHEREFTRNEFISFLSEHFTNVILHDPSFWKIPDNFLLAKCDGVIR